MGKKRGCVWDIKERSRRSRYRGIKGIERDNEGK